MSEQEIQRYKEMLAKDPKSRAFAPLAELYRKMARLDDAISTAQEGLKHYPSYSGGLVVLGRSLFEKGDLEHSLEVMSKAVKEAPENYMAQKFLGKVLMARGDLERAIQALEAANLLSPDDQEVTSELGKLRAKVTPPETIQFEPSPSEAQSEFTHKTDAAPAEPQLPEMAEVVAGPAEALEEMAEIDLAELTDIEELSEADVSMAEEEPVLAEDGFAHEVYVPEEELAGLEDLEELVPDQYASADAEPAPSTTVTAGFSAETAPEEATEEDQPVMVSEPVSFGPDSALMEFSETPRTEGLELGEPGLAADGVPVSAAASSSSGTSSPPVRSASGTGEGISTETLADLYAQQGFTDKALLIYRQLLERRPGDEGLLAKLATLEMTEPGPVEATGMEEEQAPPVQPESAPSEGKAPVHDPVAALEDWLANLERMKRT